MKRLWIWNNGDYGFFEKGIIPYDKRGRFIKDKNGKELREYDVIRWNDDGDPTEAEVILEGGKLEPFMEEFLESGIEFEIRGNLNEDIYLPDLEPML